MKLDGASYSSVAQHSRSPCELGTQQDGSNTAKHFNSAADATAARNGSTTIHSQVSSPGYLAGPERRGSGFARSVLWPLDSADRGQYSVSLLVAVKHSPASPSH